MASGRGDVSGRCCKGSEGDRPTSKSTNPPTARVDQGLGSAELPPTWRGRVLLTTVRRGERPGLHCGLISARNCASP